MAVKYIIDNADSSLSAQTINGNLNVTGTISSAVKRYVALLNQATGESPVATVLENTLNGIPVWESSGTGYFNCNLVKEFPANKTVATISLGYSTRPLFTGISNDGTGDTVGIVFFDETGVNVDPNNSPANDITVIIEVYP